MMRKRFWGLALAVAAVLALVAPGGVSAQDAAPASAEYYCWATGVVDEDASNDDRTWGGDGGRGALAAMDDWGVSAGDRPLYVHYDDSDGVEARYGGWDLAEGKALYSDYAGPFAGLSQHWALDYVDAVGYRPVGDDVAGLDEGVPSGRLKSGVSGGGNDYWHKVGAASHSSRAALVDMLFRQPPTGETANRWRKVVQQGYVAGSDETWSTAAFDTDDRRLWAPWSVGVPLGQAPFRSFTARWIDPANPEGGDAVDEVALLLQQQAADAGLAARTATVAENGYEETITADGTETGAMSVAGNCRTSSNGMSSSANCTLQPRQVTVTVRSGTAQEFNRGEVLTQHVDPSGTVKRCLEWDSSGTCTRRQDYDDGSAIAQVQLDEMTADPAAFKRDLYADTLSDRLEVVLELRPDYRVDLADFHGESFARFGMHPGLGDRVLRDSRSGVYRQPYLTAPVSLPGSDYASSVPHEGGQAPLLPWSLGSGWSGGASSVIRWPVYLKDLNWFLFELPEGSDLSPGADQPPAGTNLPSRYTWRHNADLWEWTARSAYGAGGTGARRDFPQCAPLSLDDPARHRCFNSEPRLNIASGDYGHSSRQEAFFPFYTAGVGGSDPGALQPGWLKMAGTAGAVDAEETGFSRNTEFSFTVTEGNRYGGGIADAPEAGAHALERVGQPVAGTTGDSRGAWLSNWPQSPVDPNRTHLLVLAFYEVRQAGTVEYQVDRQGAADPVVYRQPTWQVRRVLCRAVVGDLATVSGESWLKRTFGNIGDGIVDAVLAIPRFIGSLAGQVLGGMARAVEAAGQEPLRVVCAGVTGLRQATGSPSVVDLQNAVIDRGTVVVSAARRAELAAVRACQDEAEGVRVETAQVAPLQCGQGSVLDADTGKCWSLPRPELFRYDTRVAIPRTAADLSFLDESDLDRYQCDLTAPASVTTRSCWYDYGIHPVTGDRIANETPRRLTFRGGSGGGWDTTTGPPVSNYPHHLGLASTQLRWHTPVNARPEQAALVRGWVITIAQDPRLASYATGPPADADHVEHRFVVPRALEVDVCATNGTPSVVPDVSYRVDRLTVGDVPTIRTGNATVGCPDPVAGRYAGPRNSIVERDFRALVDLVDTRLPVVPGFRHGVQVAAYSGSPDSSTFTVGPASDWLWLDGNDEACRDLLRDNHLPAADRLAVGNPHVFGGGGSAADDVKAAARANERRWVSYRYRCADWDVGEDTPLDANATALGGAQRPAEAVDTSFLAQSGVLTPFMDSGICRDIFTGTPGRFLWDNSVVQNLWKLMWVLAGMVLAGAIAWQALRMTYDMWIEPRPSFGLREMLPRTLLAIVLAASSLLICEIVLSLVHDLSCFISEATGVTLWGFLGNTIGGLVLAWLSNMRTAYAGLWGSAGALFTLDFGQMAQSLGQYVTGLIRFYFLGSVTLLGIILVLVLWVKVVIQMMTRIVLLAALIVFSPLAFAMYAAPDSAHWTKRWVTMFLGTAFQQAVVLVVLALGGAMMLEVIRFDADTWHGSVEPGLVQLVMAIIMGFLAIFLASSVPKIVNPSGQGMFDSVRSLGQMALAGAVMAASMGVGAVGMGAAGAARGAAAAGGGGGGDPGSSPDPGSAPGSGTTPGGGTAGGGGGGFAGRLAGAAQRAGTGARGFAGGATEGAIAGFRRGQDVNMRMRDVLGGNFMYRGGSQSDDRAVQKEGEGAAQKERHKEMMEELKGISKNLAGTGGGQPAAPPLPSQPASPLYTPPNYQRGGGTP